MQDLRTHDEPASVSVSNVLNLEGIVLDSEDIALFSVDATLGGRVLTARTHRTIPGVAGSETVGEAASISIRGERLGWQGDLGNVCHVDLGRVGESREEDL